MGTNQLLVMADRRGGRPFLTNPELQALSDLGRSAEEDLGAGYRQHERDAHVPHQIVDNLGSVMHAGHWDAGFTHTSSWPELSDGSRLGVIGFGLVDRGPLLVCWDRPAGATPWPAGPFGCDLLALVVEGSITHGDREMGRLAFRAQHEGAPSGSMVVGPHGARVLWLLADRRSWRPDITGAEATAAQAALVDEVADQVDHTTRAPAA